MKTFCWREFRIEEAKEALTSRSQGSSEDQWVTLHRECFEVVNMVLAVRKPLGPVGDPVVALKTKLGKAVLLFQVTLTTAVNMFPPVCDVDAGNTSCQPISNDQGPGKRERQTNRSISRAHRGTGQRPFSGRELGR